MTDSKPQAVDDSQHMENLHYAGHILSAVEELMECDEFSGFSDDAIKGIGYMVMTAKRLIQRAKPR